VNSGYLLFIGRVIPVVLVAVLFCCLVGLPAACQASAEIVCICRQLLLISPARPRLQ